MKRRFALQHQAPIVILDTFGIIGAEEPNVECLAFTLPEELGVDGSLGLNYLHRFRRVTLDFIDGTLILER